MKTCNTRVRVDIAPCPFPVGRNGETCDYCDADVSDLTGQAAVLPPSVLVPAPKWAGRVPRILKLYFPPQLRWKNCGASSTPPRVRKARAERTDLDTGAGSTHLAHWKVFS